MKTNEIEAVLANWIRRAFSGPGEHPEGTDAAAWIAARFAEWWKERAEDTLGGAERAASAIHDELVRLGGWEPFGDAMHESCHLRDALADLREILGLADEASGARAG
jgi:hypothetical protein